MSRMSYLISENYGSFPGSDLKCFTLFDLPDQKVVEEMPLVTILSRTSF